MPRVRLCCRGQGSDWEPRSSLCGHCGPGCAQASCVSLCPVVSFRALVTLILGGHFCGRAVLMVEWGGARGLLCRCPLPGWCWGPDRPGSPSGALAALLSLLEGGRERRVSRLGLLILLWGEDGGAVVAPSAGGWLCVPPGTTFSERHRAAAGPQRLPHRNGLWCSLVCFCLRPCYVLLHFSPGEVEGKRGVGVSIPL